MEPGLNGSGLTLVSQREAFRLDTGTVQTYTYRGTYDALVAARDDAIANGYEAEITNSSGLNELVIATPATETSSTSDVITDDWDINTQFTEIDYWADPNVRNYLIGTVGISSGSVDADMTIFRWNVEEYLAHYHDSSDAISDTLAGPSPVANFKPKESNGTTLITGARLTYLNEIYQQMVFGMKKSRTSSVTVTRRREISTASATRYDMRVSGYAWRPATFPGAFDVPTEISAKLPSPPGSSQTPIGCTWAWALTAQNFSTTHISTRGVERLEWVFGACRNSSFIFDP